MNGFVQDLRFAFRGFAKSPGYAAVAIVTLALGIGGTTAMFSFVEAVLLRHLPVRSPGELVVLGPGGSSGVTGTSQMPGSDNFAFSQYEGLREQNDVFQSVAAAATFNVTTLTRRPADDPEAADRLQTQLVTADYFTLMGLRPAAGRLFDDSDLTAPGADAVVVVGHAYWTRKLGGSAEVVGSTLMLQDLPYRVVGVAPPGFEGHSPDNPAELWVPLTMQAQITRADSRFETTPPTLSFWLNIIGRLRPGLTLEEAEGRLNVRMQQIFLADYGDTITPELRADIARVHVPLTPASGGLSSVRERLRTPLTVLWAATGLILMIGCSNLANILLARAADRRREISIRRALGAAGARVVRQMLTESLLLAGLGAAAGIALASWLIPTLESIVAGLRGPNRVDAGLEPAVLLFSCGASLLTVLLFGLGPAFWAARRDIAEGLKAGARGATPSRGHALTKSALVGGQAALSVVLLSGAGLFLRTLAELRAVDLGVDTDNVVLMRTNAQRAGLPREGDDAMRRLVLERIRRVPGVLGASFTTDEPVSGNYFSTTANVEGYEPAPNEDTNVVYKTVTDGYFEALGIGLVEGRALAPADSVDQSCFVSRAFAARFFRGRSALGGVIDSGDRRCIVHGVVEDVREVRIRDEPAQVVYRPAFGYNHFLPLLIARVEGDPQAASEAIRAAIVEAAPALPVNRGFSLLSTTVDRALTIERLLSRVTAVFAAVALLLAAVGLFGLMSYVVRQRTPEIGLRQALGATHAEVVGMTLRQAATPVICGALVGVAGATLVGRGVEQLLFRVKPTDTQAIGAALAALLAAGFLAALLPARCAARIAPTEALRHE